MIFLNRTLTILCNLVPFFSSPISAQATQDSVSYDYPKLYSYALDANITPLLEMINNTDTTLLTSRSKQLRSNYLKRFAYQEDISDYLEKRRSPLDTLLKIYTSYWRQAMVNPKKNFDSVLLSDLNNFFATKYMLKKPITRDTLNVLYQQYIKNAGYHSTAFGKTGRLFDLLIWKEEHDTNYTFRIKDEEIKTPVVFMDKFFTLGWTEYATLDRYYPGGWAKTNALYVVKKAYDLKSEAFTVSYLAHEGTHFTDYRRFPKLSGIDNEYRAKLIELALAKTSLIGLIQTFINNANAGSTNPHPLANYFVVRDLSTVLFKNDFEKDIAKWKAIHLKNINKQAYKLFKKNTRQLKKQPKDINRFIK